MKKIEKKYNYSDVLIVPGLSRATSRQDINLETKLLDLDVVPIIAANMDTTGTIENAIELSKFKMLTALHKHYEVDKLVDFFKTTESQYAFYSMGTREEDWIKLRQFSSKANIPRLICLDVANGHTESFIENCKALREFAKDSYILAGNIVTQTIANKLLQIGINCAKVGIGPGLACTTRKQTGIGYPQLSAVMECSDILDTCADGGCSTVGDIAKAFCGGASFVMLGGMLAGYLPNLNNKNDLKIKYKLKNNIQNQPEKISDLYEAHNYIEFYGMSSLDAMEKYGGLTHYKTPEGRTLDIALRGTLDNIAKEILGGLRSTCTYVGANNLQQLSQFGQFVETTHLHSHNFGD